MLDLSVARTYVVCGTDIALRTDLMAASHKSLSIPDLMYHSHQVDFDGMRKLCAELMPYEWSHMDEPMVWFEMVREQAQPVSRNAVG